MLPWITDTFWIHITCKKILSKLSTSNSKFMLNVFYSPWNFPFNLLLLGMFHPCSIFAMEHIKSKWTQPFKQRGYLQVAEKESLFLFTQLSLPIFGFSSFKKYTLKNSINCNLWEISSLIASEASCFHHWWKDFVMHFKSKVLKKCCLDKAVQMDCLMCKSTAVITDLTGYLQRCQWLWSLQF